MGAKGLMLWVMCSETGKGEEKGETCKCDRDSPASQTWADYVVLQETVGLCLLLPAGNGISAATGLCCSAGSPELKLPMCLLSADLCFC